MLCVQMAYGKNCLSRFSNYLTDITHLISGSSKKTRNIILNSCVSINTKIIQFWLSLFQSEASWSGPEVNTFYNPPPEPSLFVYESIELELSLTTVAIETDEMVTDDFSCLIRLHLGKFVNQALLSWAFCFKF